MQAEKKGSAIEGIKVVDLTRVIAGPLAGQILADLGADVIKIERPGTGDDVRHLGPPWLKDSAGRFIDEATYFSAVNRGKRSATIDFSQSAGAALVRKLISRADVVLENFRPGTLSRYGLDYASLAASNPRLIYCSVTGFGQTGPLRERAGYDFLMQGMAGVMSVTGKPGSGPTRAGLPIADYAAGLTAALGVLAALNFRHVTGRGQAVDVALFDCQVSMLLNVFSAWFNSGVQIQQANDHPSACPHGVFPTADGHIIIATMSDAQFVRVADILGRPEWHADPRFATNGNRVAHGAELVESMSRELESRGSEYWLREFEAANIPAGPINQISELSDHPQLHAREMVVSFPDPRTGDIKAAGNPLKLSESPVDYRLPPPKLGQHTAAVLGEELGLSADEISTLRARSII
ncbi:MAG TPA: CaiB/BaiF CoA-transferase family protein [Burkholderiaceae bacterium]|nr:CaiB/BaiF CoA-transferase family protein [Burkholderiaceae bacterium]